MGYVTQEPKYAIVTTKHFKTDIISDRYMNNNKTDGSNP